MTVVETTVSVDGRHSHTDLLMTGRHIEAASDLRLRMLFERDNPKARDVIEESYAEQVLREWLEIFERRREWWRIIRWGSTTALGLVLAAWSAIQGWDRLFGDNGQDYVPRPS